VFRVACIQNCATDDVAANIAQASVLVESAHRDGAELICLPEYFACLEPQDHYYLSRGYPEDRHPALPHFRELAARLGTWILLGSLCVKISDDKVNNRSYLLNGNGDVVATYDKVHLFDVALPRGEIYRESRTVQPGTRTCVAETPWGALGLTICYDLRFPHLYRVLAKAGALFITVPAAFTQTTGEAHWHVLLRARAIETGCFIFAPGQCGVRPWGPDGGAEVGYVVADVDAGAVGTVRARVPSLQHDRPLEP
jgi:predicted amidohydrolase